MQTTRTKRFPLKSDTLSGWRGTCGLLGGGLYFGLQFNRRAGPDTYFHHQARGKILENKTGLSAGSYKEEATPVL